MKIINLIENTKGENSCLIEHGLSFYIETGKHKLLVDTGASDAFLDNAKTLGVDLTEVDTVILSHGHYDHAGGILSFLKQNDTAMIWMQQSAGDAYYHKSETEERYIGIDPQILESKQLHCVEGNHCIDNELFLFSGIKERKLWPSGNRVLKVKREDKFVQDEFAHEQYLVVEEKGKRVLISGCAHNGILNILEEYERMYGGAPDVVLSGFHLMKKSEYCHEDVEMIRRIAIDLKERSNTRFYTGHCTGEIPFQIMHEMMGEQLVYVHSGDIIEC